MLVFVISLGTNPLLSEIWVSPKGSDTSGTGSQLSPLKSPLAARDLVRSRRAQQYIESATIFLAGGVYKLTSTLNLTALDSNTTWQPWPGTPHSPRDLPTFSGGVSLDWRPTTSTQGRCRLFNARFPPNIGKAGRAYIYPQLFVNGERAEITRLPVSGFYYWSPVHPPWNASRSFAVNLSTVDPSQWADLTGNKSDDMSDVSLVVSPAPWSFVARRWKTVSPAGVISATTAFDVALDGHKLPGAKRFYVVNVQRGPIAPGAYRYSSRDGGVITLNYCGSDAPSAVLPDSDIVTLLRITDDARNITFDSVKFSHTPSGHNPSSYSYGPAESGAVEVSSAVYITFRACSFTHLGANGFQLRHNASHVAVKGSIFLDIGGRGYTTTLEHTNSEQDAENIMVTDSVFDGCGKIFLQQPYCVFVSGRKAIEVSHNEITATPYAGIRIWAWNVDIIRSAAFKAGIPVFNVSFNHVHGVGMNFLSDFGAIFITTRPAAGTSDCVSGYGAARCNVAALVHGSST